MDEFCSFKLHNEGRAAATVRKYAKALELLRQFAGERDPAQLSAQDLLQFSGVWLHKRGLKPAGRRPYVAAVREFWSWAASRRLVEANAAESVPYPRAGTRLPKVMPLEALERLMYQPDYGTLDGVRDGAIIALLAATGMRVSGLCGLNESDLMRDVIEGRPRVIVRVVEKGKRERRVPLDVSAELILTLYREHPDLVAIDRQLPNGDQVLFVSLRNRCVPVHEYHGERRRISAQAVLALMQRHGRAAGIREDVLHPHALRHLMGTELVESEVHMITAQKIMGHADPKSTEIYTHVAMRRLARDVDRGNPLAKIRTPMGELLARLKGKGAPP